MLKREIKYEDFNGNQASETVYFNLTKTEIIDLELSYDGGLEATLNKIIESQNVREIVSEFKKIVLLAYGVRSDDGKRFVKSDELREEFSQTAAYDALFVELATDADAASDFVKGIIPADLLENLPTATETVNLPPLPPSVS